MTRINAGIITSELCDQMLLAEYRELPRMVAFCQKRLDKYGDIGPHFYNPTLGTGHMSYFLPYGNTLCLRYSSIVHEMCIRGFSPSYVIPLRYPGPMGTIPEYDHARWRSILIPRIRLRLSQMKRTPTWTNSERPSWSYP